MSVRPKPEREYGNACSKVPLNWLEFRIPMLLEHRLSWSKMMFSKCFEITSGLNLGWLFGSKRSSRMGIGKLSAQFHECSKAERWRESQRRYLVKGCNSDWPILDRRMKRFSRLGHFCDVKTRCKMVVFESGINQQKVVIKQSELIN